MTNLSIVTFHPTTLELKNLSQLLLPGFLCICAAHAQKTLQIHPSHQLCPIAHYLRYQVYAWAPNSPAASRARTPSSSTRLRNNRGEQPTITKNGSSTPANHGL